MNRKKLKVAFFLGSLNRGGTEMLVLDTFRCKNVAQYEPILIYRNEGVLSEAYRATGVPMYRIKPNKFKSGYVFQLRRLLKQEKVDILHTQTLLNAFLGVFCTCFSKVKLVASFHGMFPSFWSQVYAHIVMWSADALVFVSVYEQNWYRKRMRFVSQKKYFVVYNGIDFSKFDKEYGIPDFLLKADTANPEILKFAMVGSFGPVRNQEFLCHVFKVIRDSIVCDFCFYFIGTQWASNPELFDKCVDYCRTNELLNTSVFFVGGRSDIPAILQNVDAFVYCSNKDTFGIAVVEAMASGTPVIVNDWDVMQEITNNGELATIYKTNDVMDCVMKLKDFVANRDEYLIMAKKSAEAVRKSYSIENHIKNLYRVYETTIL